MITTACLAALALLPAQNAAQNPDQAERMLRLATAEEPLAHAGVVPAPLPEVWKAWTTNDGITKWMVPAGTVDLRVGGKYRTSYTPGSDLNGPDTIENTILAFDPGRMITIQNTKAPERFPFKAVMEKVWTVIYFEPQGDSQTKVVIRMVGWTHEEQSQQCKDFFRQGNQATLDALINRFKN